jgi:hypothetical protein
MVTSRKYGISAWVNHVEGWLNFVDPAASFTLVRYEDIAADAAAEVKRMYRLLGVALSDELIATAVERSRIENMRALETEFSRTHPALKTLQFVRPNAVGGARAPLSEDVLTVIENKAGTLMTKLQYAKSE